MRFLAISTFLLAIIGIFAQNNEAILALTWYAGFCEWATDCWQDTIDDWDHQSFTIHGFWPQAVSRRDFGKFNERLLDDQLLAEMRNYWPAQSRKTQKSPTFLWEHEYDQHGSDFADIYLNQHPKDFAGKSVKEQNAELQRISFRYIVDLYKSLKVRKIPSDRYTKASFAKAIGLNENEFNLVCNEGTGTLQEIRVCYNILPSGAKVIKCRSVQARNCKSNEVILGGWKKNPKAPVTA